MALFRRQKHALWIFGLLSYALNAETFTATLTGNGCSGTVPIQGTQLDIPFPAFHLAGPDFAKTAAVECSVTFLVDLPANIQPTGLSPHLQIRNALAPGTSAVMEGFIEVTQRRTLRHRRSRSAPFFQDFAGPAQGEVAWSPDGFLPSSGFCGGEMQVTVHLFIETRGPPVSVVAPSSGLFVESLKLDAHSPRDLTLFPCTR